MKQTIVPGAQLDVLTEDEARELLRREYRQTVEQRIRAEGTVKLDATGTGVVEIYTCPVGFEFEARRIMIASDLGYYILKTTPSGGGGAGANSTVRLEYLRSGESLGRPNSDNVITSATPNDEVWFILPHTDTWSREQGPYIRNGETLELAVRGIAALANINMQVTAEGLQRRPPPVVG